jgi:hypothetical protein
MDGLSATPHNNAVHYYYERDNVHVEIERERERDVLYSYELLRVRGDRLREKVLLKECPVEHVSCYRGRRRKTIVGSSELLFSDGLYAEVLF